jgi:hypothetical protein
MSTQQFTYTPDIITLYTTAAGEQSPQPFTIKVTNDTDAAVTCGKFEFDLPIGADGISGSGAGITFISSDPTWNTISHGDGTLTAWSTEGSPSLSAGWTVTFTVGRVNTGATPLQTSIAVTEWSGPGNTAVTARPLAVDLIASTMDITTFMANPVNVLPGGSSHLSWTTTRSPTLMLSWEGQDPINVSGSTSYTVTPSLETTYTLQATEQGLPTRQKQVNVGVSLPEILSFVASPDVVVSGQPFTLSWRTTNTDNISIDPPGYTGNKRVGTLESQTVTATTTYTLTATLDGENPTQQSTTVTCLPVTYFYAMPASPTMGPPDLYWSVSTAMRSLSITATDDETTTTIASDLPSSGYISTSSMISPTIYTLVYEDANGQVTTSVTATFGKTQVLQFGFMTGSVACWRTAYASICNIQFEWPSENWGTVGNPCGSQPPIVSTYEGVQYNCSVSSICASGNSAVVSGDPREVPSYYSYSIPVVTYFYATPGQAVYAGQSVTLSWSAQAGTPSTSYSIDQGIGSVASSGTTVVTPYETTTYTLTCTDPDLPVTASVTVVVV